MTYLSLKSIVNDNIDLEVYMDIIAVPSYRNNFNAQCVINQN